MLKVIAGGTGAGAVGRPGRAAATRAAAGGAAFLMAAAGLGAVRAGTRFGPGTGLVRAVGIGRTVAARRRPGSPG